MMSKTDFELIARVLRDATLDSAGWTDHAALVAAFADALHDASRYTANGNRRFDKDRFVAASQPPTPTTFGEWLDSLGDDHGLNNAIGYEARCDKCGESFNPSGDEIVRVQNDGDVLVEHYQTHGPTATGEYDVECGGFGPFVGAWGARRHAHPSDGPHWARAEL